MYHLNQNDLLIGKKEIKNSTEHKQIESAGDNLGCAITQVLDFFSSNKREAFPQ